MVSYSYVFFSLNDYKLLEDDNHVLFFLEISHPTTLSSSINISNTHIAECPFAG